MQNRYCQCGGVIRTAGTHWDILPSCNCIAPVNIPYAACPLHDNMSESERVIYGLSDKEIKIKELFDMVYSWGKMNIVTDFEGNAFRKSLKSLLSQALAEEREKWQKILNSGKQMYEIGKKDERETLRKKIEGIIPKYHFPKDQDQRDTEIENSFVRGTKVYIEEVLNLLQE